MDFFDTVAEKSKEIGRAVADAAGDVVDKSKDMYNLAVARGDFRDACREYGEFVYECERSGKKDLDKKSDFIKRLDEAKSRVDALNAAEAEKKGRVAERAAQKAADAAANVCAGCGAPKVSGQLYCGKCGAKYE